MGIKIMTDGKPVKVWRSEKNGYASYAISIGKKEGDTWINDFQPVRFLKGIDVPNGAEIVIKNAFPTLDTWVKDGQQFKRKIWQIMDFEGPRLKQDNYTTQEADLPEEFSAVEDSIPF